MRETRKHVARRPLVCVVDDDESVRESLPDLIGEFGYTSQAFSSAEEFLNCNYLEKVKCAVLDIAMPTMSGPELLEELRRRGLRVPVIFITADTNDRARSRVLKQGAVACLFKPFSDTALREALSSAMQAL